MSEFKLKMSGRALIKVSNIHHKVGKGDLQKDNWVTIGVVVHRTEPRQSASVSCSRILQLTLDVSEFIPNYRYLKVNFLVPENLL